MKFINNFFFWAFVVVGVWAGVPVLSKLAAQGLSGVEMTFWVNFFALPVVTLWVLPRQHRATLTTRYTGPVFLRLAGIGLLGNFLYQILYFSSYHSITALTGSVLGQIGGIFFVAASIVFLNEKPSKASMVALVLASVGAILSTARPDHGFTLELTTGFWLLLVANLCNTVYAFLNNAIKKVYTDVRVNLFVFKLATFILLLLWVVLSRVDSVIPARWSINRIPSLRMLVAPAVIGALGDGVGFLAWLKLLSLGDSVKVTMVGAAVTVTQVILAIVIFRQSATWVNAFLAPVLVTVPITWISLVEARVSRLKTVEAGTSSQSRKEDLR